MSAIDSEADNEPAEAGLNSTEIVQLAPTANEAPQVVADLIKELAAPPVMASDVRAIAAVPEFFIVTICAAVVDPTAVEAKVRLVGVRVMAGAVTVVGHAFTRFVTFIDPRPVVRS